MDEHAMELFRFSMWIIGVLGGITCATFVWGVKAGLKRMDAQDSKMEEQNVQLSLIRELLASELKLLREDHHALDKRVTRIEERCDLTVARNNGHKEIK